MRALLRAAKARVTTVLLESALAPVMLVDTGGALWSEAQVDGLINHRFELAHGGPRSTISTWRFRSDQRFGQRYFLVFGMAPAVQAALDAALAEGDVTGTAIEPAFAWGLRRARRCWGGIGGRGWLIWPEQDRKLVARVRRSHVEWLNPAGFLKTDAGVTAADLEQAVSREFIRLHATETLGDTETVNEQVILAAWHSNEAAGAFSGRVSVLALGSDGIASPPQSFASLASAPAPKAMA